MSTPARPPEGGALPPSGHPSRNDQGRPVTAVVSPEGDLDVTLPHISRVGLANLTDVVEHRIERHFDSVSHYLRLANGGEIRLAYTLTGKLLELGGAHVSVQITPEGDCLFSAYWPPTA